MTGAGGSFQSMPLQRTQSEVAAGYVEEAPFDASAVRPAVNTGDPRVLTAAEHPLPVFPPIPPAPSPAPAAAEPVATSPPVQLTVQQMLRAKETTTQFFRFRGDAEKVKVLQLYLFLRQLVSTLSFEEFLERYAAIADHDEVNLKHPTDAVDFYLPRTAKKAAARGVPQWNSADVLDYLALYVDMIREAEVAGVQVPLSLNAFLGSEALHAQFRNGDFAEAAAPKPAKPAAPPKEKPTKRAKTQLQEAELPVEAVGQRVIYTMPGGRMVRGYVVSLGKPADQTELFADVAADSGELFPNIPITELQVCADPPPNPPQTAEGDSLPVLATGNVRISKNPYANALKALAMPVAMGVVRLGDAIDTFTHKFNDDNEAVISIVNGETGPYVDAFLRNAAGAVVYEVNPPRKNLDGTYSFVVAGGVYILNVSGRE